MTVAFSLPNGKAQFCDANGKPLALGSVYTYIPATSTPQATYQDITASVTNSNPITLDSSGECLLFATGAVRQVVFDSLGNQIWDVVTQVPTLSVLGAVPLAGGTMTGTLTAPDVSVTGGQALSIAPTGNTITTLTSLNVQGTTTSNTTREFMFAAGMNVTTGKGLAGGNQDKVTGYFGATMSAGGGDAWSINSVLTIGASAETASNAQGYELDFNNNLAHRGDGSQGAGLAAPVAYGISVTGAGAYRSTSAILVSGPGTAIWNRGLCFANTSVYAASIQDLTNSTISYEIVGTHDYGIDTNSAAFNKAALRLGNGALIKARDVGNANDLAVLVQSGANLLIGDSSGTTGVYVKATTAFAPFTDNANVCGSNSNRWSAVWATNGTIQTSNIALKTDIKPLDPDKVAQIFGLIRPIAYKWIDGGNGRPGKRQHWGWNAEEVRDAFAAVGEDFGGYVTETDPDTGVVGHYLRPDQLVPVLWAMVQQLSDRVAALENKVQPLTSGDASND